MFLRIMSRLHIGMGDAEKDTTANTKTGPQVGITELGHLPRFVFQAVSKQ